MPYHIYDYLKLSQLKVGNLPPFAPPGWVVVVTPRALYELERIYNENLTNVVNDSDHDAYDAHMLHDVLLQTPTRFLERLLGHSVYVHDDVSDIEVMSQGRYSALYKSEVCGGDVSATQDALRVADESEADKSKGKRSLNLEDKDLSGGEFLRVDFSSALMNRVNMDDALVLSAKLRGVQAHEVSAVNAVFMGSDLKRSDFTGSNMLDTNLVRCNLSYANFKSAFFYNSKLKDAYCYSLLLDGASLMHTDMRNADLTHASFCGSDMLFTNLSGACLLHADLEGAYMYDVDVTDAAYIVAVEAPSHLPGMSHVYANWRKDKLYVRCDVHYLPFSDLWHQYSHDSHKAEVHMCLKQLADKWNTQYPHLPISVPTEK